MRPKFENDQVDSADLSRGHPPAESVTCQVLKRIRRYSTLQRPIAPVEFCEGFLSQRGPKLVTGAFLSVDEL